MGHYIPSTSEQQKEMLEAIELSSMEDLFVSIPKELQIETLNLPSGKSEKEIRSHFEKIGQKNRVFDIVYRGAGAYKHYIPSIVEYITTKETFLTAYTPYQAEISQGILQSIFEYQSMICELTGMDVSNASVYDGATAAAEAVAMCVDRKRKKVLVSSAVNPDVLETIKTYTWASGAELVLISETNGLTDLSNLETLLDETVSCVYIQQPNYYGLIEDCTQIGKLSHDKGAKFIMGVNPIATSILKTPGECGADIAVGEGQPLGLPLSFGGPYLGFMASTSALMRKLPGRIAGETIDANGNRAFVLTLQAREQHIRREKASSNVCSNQALCAMRAAVYMSTMGPDGIREVAEQSMAKAHYFAEELEKIGLNLIYKNNFFNEFVTKTPIKSEILCKELENNGILAGLPIEQGILWCVTEVNQKEEIDQTIQIISDLLKKEGV